MTDTMVPFDAIRTRVTTVLRSFGSSLEQIGRFYVVRDLMGRVRLTVSEAVEDSETCRATLAQLADRLHETLGTRAYGPEDAVLFVDSDMLEDLRSSARDIDSEIPGVYWVDRLVTGSDWWTVGNLPSERGVRRYTLYAVKGGVGRSTTAAVLASYLAEQGEQVMVLDLDLESPGLSVGVLAARKQPRFGIVDWFVEDLVGQGDHVVEAMVAYAWDNDFDGDVLIVPAHGADPGEYLAKLGRVYLDTNLSWTMRLGRLLAHLEERYKPSIVLLESRSGLHDIAAATVTDLNAQVLLFAVDADSHWSDYSVLFRHWQQQGLATEIRDRLSIVSALTTETYTEQYLRRFQERSWSLFRDHLYDEVSPDQSGDRFSFDLDDDHAPHSPIPIYWTRGLAAGSSLREVGTPLAYLDFLLVIQEMIDDDRNRDLQ